MWRRRRALFWQQTNYLSAGSTSLFFSFLPWKAIFHVWNGNEWLQWSSIKGTSSSSCREKAWMIFYLNPNTMDLINILFHCFKKKDSDNGGCKKLTAHRVQCTVNLLQLQRSEVILNTNKDFSYWHRWEQRAYRRELFLQFICAYRVCKSAFECKLTKGTPLRKHIRV